MNLAVLGATGSVGSQTLSVARRRGHRVVALAARRASPEFWRLVEEFRPEAYTFDEGSGEAAFGRRIAGPNALTELALWPAVDTVVLAVTGFAGLAPMLAAVQAGRRVAAATKEAIIAGGDLLRGAVADGLLLPVDSEHAAAYQLLRGRPPETVRRLIITTSGGALRDWPIERLAEAAPEDALRHPNWNMGNLITIDSATLINKGIELIEAHVLFGLPFAQLDVWIHPTQIVHALCETVDGALYASLARPDMQLPIEQALAHPNVPEGALRPLEPEDMAELRFARPDPRRYPSLRLCRDAGTIGGTMPAVLTAADQVAVRAFLAGEIGFASIVPLVASVLERHEVVESPDLEALTAADRWARQTAEGLLRRSEVR
ncbi:MAG: 1-deoxy-D-xylulose-5-phosphate reductoisomerase [Thermaerobacter sp.]|nr:1-deoxy-D-xylulose-5-phosphate reductoisomerase [Thermaerobacter sp.]